jgi:hypothetical protein
MKPASPVNPILGIITEVAYAAAIMLAALAVCIIVLAIIP